MKKIIYYFLTVTILLGGLSLTSHAAVDGKYTLLEPLPCIPTATEKCNGNAPVEDIDIDEYIEYVFKFAIAISVFLAVVVIIFGGFEYMLSESFTKKDTAKTRITNAVLGLLAALLSYLILATIDPRLVSLKTQIEPIRKDFVNKDEIKAFQDKLSLDLQALKDEDRAKAQDLRGDIESKKKAIQELEEKLKKIDTDQYNYDPVEYEKNKVQLEALKQGVKQDESSLVTLSAKRQQQISFDGAIRQIKINSYTEEVADHIQRINDSVDPKKDSYFRQILATDPEQAQILQKRAEHFKNQVIAEQKFSQVMEKYEDSTGSTKKTGIEKIEKVYKEGISGTLPNNDPELKALLITIYKERLNRLEAYKAKK